MLGELLRDTALGRVCVYYCRTYYKAVRRGGRRRVKCQSSK
jgi:hypothetical protein